jgi:hypothetical protein
MIQLGTRARVLPLQTIPILNSPLLDIAGVGVVIARGEAAGQGFHILAPAPEVEIKRGVADGVHLRTVNARRARLMFQAVAATSRADAIDKLRSYEFQLADTMIVEGARDGFVCRKPDGEPEIAFSLDRANKITLRVDMAGGQGYLLLADAFAPGWYAWVDGSPATIHPADVAMRGVALPAGKHEVTFVYRPLGWRLGVPLAAVGLLLLSMWVARVRFVERRRRRRRADQVARVSQQAIAAKAAAQGEQAARAAQAAQLAQLTQAAQAAQAAQAGQAGPPAGAE